MRASISIDEGLWKALRLFGVEHGMTPSEVITLALKDYMTPNRQPITDAIVKKGVTMTVVKTDGVINVEPVEGPRPTPPKPPPTTGYNSRPFTPVPKVEKRK